MGEKVEIEETVKVSESLNLFPNILKIALSALVAVRPFLRMTGEQSAAFSIVIGLLGGGPAT